MASLYCCLHDGSQAKKRMESICGGTSESIKTIHHESVRGRFDEENTLIKENYAEPISNMMNEQDTFTTAVTVNSAMCYSLLHMYPNIKCYNLGRILHGMYIWTYISNQSESVWCVCDLGTVC